MDVQALGPNNSYVLARHPGQPQTIFCKPICLWQMYGSYGLACNT